MSLRLISSMQKALGLFQSWKATARTTSLSDVPATEQNDNPNRKDPQYYCVPLVLLVSHGVLLNHSFAIYLLNLGGIVPVQNSSQLFRKTFGCIQEGLPSWSPWRTCIRRFYKGETSPHKWCGCGRISVPTQGHGPRVSLQK